MPDLLFLLILGHIFGDFALQTDKMAATKGKSMQTLIGHVSIYIICMAFCLWAGLHLNQQDGFFSLTTVFLLAGLWLIHFLQDLGKVRFFNGGKQAFFFDQALHLVQIYMIRIFIYNG